MNDFAKQKIAFAIGLLAVLFTVTPLLQPFGEVGYSLFGARLTLLRLYYFLSIVLLLATYFYATQFLTERDLRYPAIAGNFLYAVAIVSPVLFIALWLVVSVLGWVTSLLKSTTAKSVIPGIVGGLVSVIGGELVLRLARSLGRKEKRAAAENLEREEMRFFNRAEHFLQTGYYDLAVVEAWKAVEVAARRALLSRNALQDIRMPLHRQIQKYELLPPELIPALNEVRMTRNLAAHAVGQITEDQARKSIDTTSRVLASLTPVGNDMDDIEG